MPSGSTIRAPLRLAKLRSEVAKHVGGHERQVGGENRDEIAGHHRQAGRQRCRRATTRWLLTGEQHRPRGQPGWADDDDHRRFIDRGQHSVEQAHATDNHRGLVDAAQSPSATAGEHDRIGKDDQQTAGLSTPSSSRSRSGS